MKIVPSLAIKAHKIFNFPKKKRVQLRKDCSHVFDVVYPAENVHMWSIERFHTCRLYRLQDRTEMKLKCPHTTSTSTR